MGSDNTPATDVEDNTIMSDKGQDLKCKGSISTTEQFISETAQTSGLLEQHSHIRYERHEVIEDDAEIAPSVAITTTLQPQNLDHLGHTIRPSNEQPDLPTGPHMIPVFDHPQPLGPQGESYPILVWDTRPPSDWEIERYNEISETMQRHIRNRADARSDRQNDYWQRVLRCVKDKEHRPDSASRMSEPAVQLAKEDRDKTKEAFEHCQASYMNAKQRYLEGDGQAILRNDMMDAGIAANLAFMQYKIATIHYMKQLG